MASLTDPATELSEIATRLAEGSPKRGAEYLATKFDVDPWSTGFFKIVACVFERADQVADIIKASDLDEHTRIIALKDLIGFKAGFTSASLVNPWSNAGHGLAAMSGHGVRLSYLQSTVRPLISYPRLNQEEIDELIVLIKQYLGSLANTSDEPLFVRQAIVDGLTAFKFQLEYVGWMGSGYLLSAFRNVIEIHQQSYEFYTRQANCDPDAMLSGMWSIVKRFKTVVESVKPYTDAASYTWAGLSLGSQFITPMLASPLLRLPPS